jgi:hypothetical protein
MPAPRVHGDSPAPMPAIGRSNGREEGAGNSSFLLGVEGAKPPLFPYRCAGWKSRSSFWLYFDMAKHSTK